MKQPNSNSIEELLAGYLDGELDAEQCAIVESALAQQPALVETLERWQQLGQSIRALPRKPLPADFAAQVLQRIDDVDGGASERVEVGHRANTNFLKAAALIAALAATIAVVTIVAPNLFDPQPKQTTEYSPENAGSSTDSTNPTGGQQDGNRTDQSDPTVDANQPAPRKLERPSLASRLKPSPANSELVDSPEAPIEQVLIIQFQADGNGTAPSRQASLRLVTNMFINNGIRLVSSSSDPELEKQFAASEPIQTEAIYVVASINQLVAAISEIQDSASIRVHAIPLKLGNAAVPAEPPSQTADADESTARIVHAYPLGTTAEKPLAGVAADPNQEFESIDRWFGLTHPIEPSRKMRLLVLVQLGE